MKTKTPRERFDAKGYAIMSYAKAHNLDRVMLSRVFLGTYTGKNAIEGSKTRKIINQLYDDGVWLAKPSWRVS